MQEIIELQSLHDECATQSMFFSDPNHPDVAEARNRFLEALQP